MVYDKYYFSKKGISILFAVINLIFLMRLVGKKKTLSTLHKSLNCARVQYISKFEGTKKRVSLYFCLTYVPKLIPTRSAASIQG